MPTSSRLDRAGPICECPDMQCDLALPLTWEQYCEIRDAGIAQRQPSLILISNDCNTPISYELVRRHEGYSAYQAERTTL